MEEQADRIAAAMKRLGIRKALVAGHSTGGEVAIALAARHPELVRRLVVLDTETDEDQVDVDAATKASVTPFIGELAWRLITEGQIRDGLKQAFSSDDYKVPQEFVDDFQDLTFTAYKKTFDESADYVDDGHLQRDFKRSRAPALILFGTKDRLVDPKAAREYPKIRPAQVEYIKGAGHAVMVENAGARWRGRSGPSTAEAGPRSQVAVDRRVSGRKQALIGEQGRVGGAGFAGGAAVVDLYLVQLPDGPRVGLDRPPGGSS